MRALHGIGVSPGVALAPLSLLRLRPVLPAETMPVSSVPAAMADVDAAMTSVATSLVQTAATATQTVAAVLEAQSLIVQDPILRGRIERRIDAGQSRADSVADAFGEFKETLASAGPYFAERVHDLDDLSYRVRAVLLGVEQPGPELVAGPRIVVAEELAPADLVSLGPNLVGVVTERGGATGHTAIVAKSMGIPAVVGCHEAAALPDGASLLVDGTTGLVAVDPEPSLVEQRRASDARRRAVAAAVTGPGRTADGHPVRLMANIGSDFRVLSGLDYEGVGLFRTEFLFLERPDPPTFDEQRTAYIDLLTEAAGRRVVFRTLDAGADKPLRFVSQPTEPNPALGRRGYRITRDRPDLIADQLRAIAAAAAATEGDVAVMAPMVATAAETADFVERARAHGLTNVGVMAEVPALILAADEVLPQCDFVSIGTNDLAQYTFAADRLLDDLGHLLDPWQPALLRLVATATEAGRRHGRPVGVCGEAASDPLLAVVFTGLGVSSLSMAPVSIPAVRAALAERSMDECRRLAEAACAAPDATAGRGAVQAMSGR